MNRVAAFFKTQIESIRSDKALQFYGVALCLILILTAYFWRISAPRLLSESYGICWPFFPSCSALRPFSEMAVKIGLALYVLVMTVGAFDFYRGYICRGFWILALGTLVKLAILIQDYRFMGNYHYMPFLVIFAYLFLPQKKQMISILIVLFYLSAGVLKLNVEWMSGSALLWRPTFLSPALFQLFCIYVVYLELCFVWLLLSKKLKYFAFGFSQVLLFHAVSWVWVGYFYPVVMFALLSLFVLVRIFPDASPVTGFATRFRLSRANRTALCLYLLMQMIPYLSPVDSALDGRYRITSLNMFDANSTCMGGLYLKYKNQMIEYGPPGPQAIRIHCDPIVYISAARQICKEQQGREDFVDVDLHLQARRASDRNFTTILREQNFCQSSRNLQLTEAR